jgi:hypothetical protein
VVAGPRKIARVRALPRVADDRIGGVFLAKLGIPPIARRHVGDRWFASQPVILRRGGDPIEKRLPHRLRRRLVERRARVLEVRIQSSPEESLQTIGSSPAGAMRVPSNRAPQKRNDAIHRCPRTRSSNPPPSSGESANFRFLVNSWPGSRHSPVP